MRPSGVHVRFILNYQSEEDSRGKRNIYPMFEHFKVLKRLRVVEQEVIYDIDRFELTIFPDMQALFKLDLRENRKPGFILLSTSEIPCSIHSVRLGETFQNESVDFKVIFQYEGSTPIFTGYLFLKKYKSKEYQEKKIFDFPIELLYTTDTIIGKLTGSRKRLLKKYKWGEQKVKHGPFPKPFERDAEISYFTHNYVNKFVTFSQDVE